MAARDAAEPHDEMTHRSELGLACPQHMNTPQIVMPSISRLRTYFMLRRHLGNAYLDLLRSSITGASCAAGASSATARAPAK
jgi:hypothetical protein